MPLFVERLRRLPGLSKDSFNQLRNWFAKQSLVARIALGVILYCVFAGSAYALFAANACAVAIDGQVVAVAADEKTAKKAVEELVKAKADYLGTDVAPAGEISYDGVRVDAEEVLGGAALKDALGKELSFQTSAVAVTVNGEDLLHLKNMEEAQQLLAWIKSIYPATADEQVDIKEPVELVEQAVGENALLALDEAKDLVLLGTSKIEQYTVVEGDTAWDIAWAFDMDPDQLQATNPGVDTWHLSIGQVLKLSKEVPLLTVVATRQVTVAEEIPYQIQEEQDDSLLPGERKIIARGTPGQKIVTYFITKENGLETERKALEEHIVQEPSSEMIKKGSQMMLASRGAARMSWPCGGGVNSAFGSRSGRMHQGIDIGGGYGNPVKASAGGVVTMADWSGGYGKLVEISHGSGIVTKYAHLSSIEVTVGQSVERGQLIGLIGSTGNSTGPHLHFEVLLNGQPQNPSSFLP